MGNPREAQTPTESDLPFEVALARLEAIVDRLEQGDLELEAALAAFEQGVALTRGCAAQLAAAERRVEVLVREGDAWAERDFGGVDGEEESGGAD